MSSVFPRSTPLVLRRDGVRQRLAGPILVTGASSGIGAATASALAARGHRVLAGVRDVDDAAPLVDASAMVEAVKLDITDRDDLARLRERLALEPRGLAGLVNNAGTISVGPIEVLDTDRWEEALRVNVLGTISVTRAAMPGLLRARGRVVTVNSPNGRVALPMFGPYAVSKFALEAFNDTLRREIGHLGVRVISVTPGPIATPMFDKGLAGASELLDSLSDDVHGRYAPMIESAMRAARETQSTGYDSSEAAEVIVRALTARWPRTRYLMGAGNHAVSALARMLPDRAMDEVIAHVCQDRTVGSEAPVTRPPLRPSVARATRIKTT